MNNNHISLLNVFKRQNITKGKKILILAITLLVAVIVSFGIAFIVINDNPIDIIAVFFEDGLSDIWRLLKDSIMLLAFGVAILAPFKMKYWNMGARGQVLSGLLVSILVMFYLGPIFASKGISNYLLLLIMLVSSIVASIIWAVLPAIFKVLFNTNETLFTLMMNYVAAGLVTYVNYKLANGMKESPGIINSATHSGWLPSIIDNYFLPIIILLLVGTIIYFYMEKTKHGYEISVVGDSINTAKYVGMNTKWIIIRTLIVSGIITGVIGFLYASAIDHAMSPSTSGALGFTGVLIAWLSNFNLFIMAIVSFMLSFLTLGTSGITSSFQLGSNNLSSIMIGIIFFSILIAQFFIQYKVRINPKFIEKFKRVKEDKQ